MKPNPFERGVALALIKVFLGFAAFGLLCLAIGSPAREYPRQTAAYVGEIVVLGSRALWTIGFGLTVLSVIMVVGSVVYVLLNRPSAG